MFGLEPPRPSTAPLSKDARRALGVLLDGPLTADEVVRATGLSPAEGTAALTELELNGCVTSEDGVYRAAV